MRLVFIRCQTENAAAGSETAAPRPAPAESSSANAILALKKSRLLADWEEWRFAPDPGLQTGSGAVKFFSAAGAFEELTQHLRAAGQPDAFWVEGWECPDYLRHLFALCPRSFKIVYAPNTPPWQIAQLQQYDLCLADEEEHVKKVNELFPGVFCAAWEKMSDPRGPSENALARLIDILQAAGRQYKAAKAPKGKGAGKRKVLADQGLPRLRDALNVETMTPAFEDFFRGEYPEREFKVLQLYLGKINYKPGQECSILYGLLCRDRENRHEGNWFYATMRAGGESLENTPAAPATWPGCRFWKPVSVWPEMNMVLHAFPYDPELPHLGQLLEADFVKTQIEANLAALDCAPGWQCREVNSRMIKYMPHKRCVLRYELTMRDGEGRERELVIFGKTYDSDESDYIYKTLQQISASPACAAGVLNIPRPVAHLAGMNTIWQLEWKGENLSRVAEQTGWPGVLQSGVLPRIAALLAAFHQTEITGHALKRGLSLATILENARGDAEDLRQHLPDAEEFLARVITALGALRRRLDAPVPQATLHGTFKIAQILCRGQELAVVDFDAVACGDPLYDVAEFLASLTYLQVSDNVVAALLADGEEEFLSAYQKAVPWPCERRRVAWYVAAFLLGKIHSSLKRAEAGAIQNLETAFQLLQKWLAAAQC